jgi:aspartate aminotransferase
MLRASQVATSRDMRRIERATVEAGRSLSSSALAVRVGIGSLIPMAAANGDVAGSYLSRVPKGAPDAILGIAQAYKECKAPQKVNLAIGAYRDEDGNPWVLPSVREAERRLIQKDEKKEYAPISGQPKFVDLALRFAYGDDCAALKDGRFAGVQALSGTGAIRLAAEFWMKFLPEGTIFYVSDPTWGNHIPILRTAGFEVRKYRYIDRETNTLGFDAFMQDIAAARAGSIFLIHACAHNPTGIDPSPAQWCAQRLSSARNLPAHARSRVAACPSRAAQEAESPALARRAQISEALLKRGHHVLMDCAYQAPRTSLLSALLSRRSALVSAPPLSSSSLPGCRASPRATPSSTRPRCACLCARGTR